MKLYDVTVKTSGGVVHRFRNATTNTPRTNDNSVIVEERNAEGKIMKLTTITHVANIVMEPVLESMNEVM